MVVGIDARELVNRPAGKGQYLLRIIDNWVHNANYSTINFKLYLNENTELSDSLKEFAKSANVEIIQQEGRGILWHIAVAKRLKKDGVSVYFASLTYLSAIVNPVPTVTVVHDLAVLRLPEMSHNS